VQDAVEAFQSSFSAKGITLTAEIATGAIVANIDQDRILQVLANLLSNALKFTDQGSVVLLLAVVGSDVRFSVTDSGVGIPAGEAKAIFERFRQVRPKDRRGLGLGLYIAKCIVEAHGGSIWAESPKAGGTVLHFTVPVTVENPAAASQAARGS
jgi:signal transduction histidine kinase